MKFFKLKNLPIILFILVFMGMEVNVFIKSKQCFQNAYHTVIDGIYIGSKKECLLYSKGEKINLMPYRITDIGIGDSISKDSCAEYVYFYKKDSLGNYYESTKLKSFVIFPRKSWFCKD
ncbi:hypothetical protein CGC54_00475 [Capnocytophaga canimorsus]|uniref:Uncharacterized protein n=1 Tax=Capnocytophaga canimorsus TaxID=28188 RepID=A0AAC9Z1S2_9FLAO|nr:hypothetical protein [Capnocytophaga canimorsus]ATA92936.1 hypothetical protein CGC54_00475 [Capnocytophaga canimorsus]